MAGQLKADRSVTAIDTMLRAADLLKLRVLDITDGSGAFWPRSPCSSGKPVSRTAPPCQPPPASCRRRFFSPASSRRNNEAVRQLVGHASLGSTWAYLNMDKKRALDIGRRFEL